MIHEGRGGPLEARFIEQGVSEPRKHSRYVRVDVDAASFDARCRNLAPGVPFARGAAGQGAVVDGVNTELHVDVKTVGGNAQDLIKERFSLQRVIFGDTAA